jgi:LysM repeat protein
MSKRNVVGLKQAILIVLMAFTPFFYGLSQTPQPVPVEISKDKVVIDGEVYYIHIVKKGQTLYSISKTYGVPQEKILEENPSASVSLEIDQPLKIPAGYTKEKPGKVYKDDDFYYHHVDTGQTLYSLSKKYDVKQSDIIKYNPGSDTLIKAGSIIKIPKDSENFTKRNFVKEDYNYIYYKVRWLETLYSISKKFDVSRQEIIAANIELEDGLKSGQIIRIPKKRTLADTIVYTRQMQDTIDTLQVQLPYKVYDRQKCDSIFRAYKESKAVNIALLMPFYSEFIYELYKRGLEPPKTDEEETDQEPTEDEEGYQLRFRSAYFIEFYQGVLLAVQQMKKENIDVNLHVFDTQRDSVTVRKIIEKMDFLDIDVIIGPAYPENLDLVAEYAHNKEIPIVNPFTTQSAITKYPYLFQVIPPDTVQLETFARFIKDSLHTNHGMILHGGDSLQIPKINFLQNKLSYQYYNYAGDTIHRTVNTFDLPRKKLFRIVDSLSTDTLNEIVVISEDMAYVNQVISQFNTLAKKFDIRAYGMPDWQKDQNIDLEFIHNIELGIYTPFYFDVKDPKTQEILRQYQAAFQYLPDRITSNGYTFGLLGYDIASYFIKLTWLYGDECMNCTPFYSPDLVLGSFSFKKASDLGGYYNSSVFFIQYTKDYKVMSWPIHNR